MIALVTSPKTGRNQKGFHTKIKTSKKEKKKLTHTHTHKKTSAVSTLTLYNGKVCCS